MEAEATGDEPARGLALVEADAPAAPAEGVFTFVLWLMNASTKTVMSARMETAMPTPRKIGNLSSSFNCAMGAGGGTSFVSPNLW